jgi:F-type H+-transporting ATPase subunit delta
MAARNVVTAEVTTAVPLSDAHRTALAAALGKAVDREVTVTERVDPSIIGGVIARVGSVVFDGSVTRQIERMHETLVAGA